MADCRNCPAMKTATYEKITVAQKMHLYRFAIVSICIVLVVAILTMGYLLNEQIRAFESLIKGMKIKEEIVVDGGEDGTAIYGDKSTIIDGNENEVNYGKDNGN